MFHGGATAAGAPIADGIAAAAAAIVADGCPSSSSNEPAESPAGLLRCRSWGLPLPLSPSVLFLLLHGSSSLDCRALSGAAGDGCIPAEVLLAFRALPPTAPPPAAPSSSSCPSPFSKSNPGPPSWLLSALPAPEQDSIHEHGRVKNEGRCAPLQSEHAAAAPRKAPTSAPPRKPSSCTHPGPPLRPAARPGGAQTT